jgi:hypothetical protein
MRFLMFFLFNINALFFFKKLKVIMSLNIADTSGTQLIVRVGNKGSSRVSGWTSFDSTSGSGSGLFVSNFENTSLTTTNLQLNGSSLNTIITGITAPSNLIATNLTTTNLQLNGSNLNTIITNLSSSTTNLTAPSNLISTNLTGQSLKITNIYQDGWLEYKAEGFPGFKIYPTSGTNGELIFNRDGGKILTIDEYLYVNTGLTTPNINSTNLTTTNLQLNGSSLNAIVSGITSITSPSDLIATTLTTTNLQLNGSSLNTILTGITAPSNLIATNLTTTNAVINSFSRHLKIDGGLTGLPAETNFELYITGNEGSPNVGSLYVGDGTGWGFNFKRRVSSTDTVLGRINDNGDFWITNEISCANLRTSNLTTTNQTVLNNLIVNGNVGIGTNNTAGVNLNVNNQSGTCRVRASGPYSAQQGLGLFDTTNNTERWIIYREGNSDNLRIWNGSSNVFDMAPSGNLGLIGSLSCGNLRASAITCSNLTVSSGNTRLDFVVGNRGSSPVDGWTTLDPNGGSNQGLFIWDGLEVSGGITGSNLQILNTINSSVISSGSLFSTNLTNLFNRFNSPVNISNGVGVTFGCNSIINFNDGNPGSTSLTLGTARQLIEGLQSSGITWNMYSSITAILYNAGTGGLTIRNSTDIIRTSTTLANIGVNNFIRLNLLRVPEKFGIVDSSTTWGSILINILLV